MGFIFFKFLCGLGGQDLPVCGILSTLGLLSSVILGLSLTQLGNSTAVKEAGLDFHSMEAALVRLGIAWCYLGFLPFTPFSYEYARAPRYLYIPSIGLVLLAAVAAEALRRRSASRLSGRTLLAMALAVGYLAASFGFARVMCANRLRDSDLRREVVAAIHERVPAPESDTAFVLRGLPEPLEDLALALPVVYGRPVEVVIDGATRVTPRYEFEFDPAAPATITVFRRVPAASGHRPR